MFRPKLARRTCAECQRWLYDEKTEEVVQRRGKPVPRPRTSPIPCTTEAKCPKGSPDREHESRLSVRNAKIVELYRIVQATAGAALPRESAGDQRLLQDLAICHDLFQRYQAHEARAQVERQITQAVTGTIGGIFGG